MLEQQRHRLILDLLEERQFVRLQELVEAAPKLIDYLGAESLQHFEGVQQLLKDAAIPYRINPRLVPRRPLSGATSTSSPKKGC